MTDQEFQLKVTNDLAEIKVLLVERDKDIVGHGKSLYGTDGRGGIVQDVQRLESSERLWKRGMVLVQALLAALVAYIGLSE